LELVAERKGTAGNGMRHQSRLFNHYVAEGYLTTDGYWIDQATGLANKHRADWLLCDVNVAPVDPDMLTPAEIGAATAEVAP
jgi:hypothetical protein